VTWKLASSHIENPREPTENLIGKTKMQL